MTTAYGQIQNLRVEREKLVEQANSILEHPADGESPSKEELATHGKFCDEIADKTETIEAWERQRDLETSLGESSEGRVIEPDDLPPNALAKLAGNPALVPDQNGRITLGSLPDSYTDENWLESIDVTGHPCISSDYQESFHRYVSRRTLTAENRSVLSAGVVAGGEEAQFNPQSALQSDSDVDSQLRGRVDENRERIYRLEQTMAQVAADTAFIRGYLERQRPMGDR